MWLNIYLKKYQNTYYHRFIFTPQTCKNFLKQAFRFYCQDQSNFYQYIHKLYMWWGKVMSLQTYQRKRKFVNRGRMSYFYQCSFRWRPFWLWPIVARRERAAKHLSFAGPPQENLLRGGWRVARTCYSYGLRRLRNTCGFGNDTATN